jgi:leucyl-tRNA synthetase
MNKCINALNKNIFPFKKYENKWKDFKINKKNGLNKYILEMWPYPSGDIHMGHVRNYTIGDIIARLKTLKGYNVFHPMGWDAHGLPAENAAIENGIHPKIWTEKNINRMKEQLKNLCLSYDWDYEISTHSQNYYKFQQELFIEMFNIGLIEKKEEYVNWDPVDKTVLANEQIINGKGWRSGAPVQQKLLSQWFCKISDYAEVLLKDIDRLEGHWPSQILTMQKNWIGKNEGFAIKFTIIINEKNKNIFNNFNEIEVFTKAPWMLPKVEFVTLAPENKLAIHLYKNFPHIEEFIKNNKRNKDIKDKRGIYTNINIINPYNNQEIPLYIGNYVLADVGTGVLMGVPSVCENDYNFAKENNILIKASINIDNKYLENIKEEDKKLTNELIKKGIVQNKITYRIKDWCISRQRYWGALIPIIYCKKCGILPNKNIPIDLPPTMEELKSLEWKKTTCYKCNGEAEKETDTMDTFFDSSWYFWRFPSCRNNEKIFDDNLKKFPAVDLYIGGPEHAVLHLLFARFFGKILKKLNYIEEDEPFRNFYSQGMICMQSYKNEKTDRYVFPKDVIEDGFLLYTMENGVRENVIKQSIEKMSKSKKNVVDPNEILQQYGVDSVRLFVVSDTPCNKDLQWNDKALNGCWCFNNRIWHITNTILEHNSINNNKDEDFNNYSLNMFNKIIYDFDKININVAIATIRIFVNYVEENKDYITKNLLINKWKDLLKLYWCLCPIISLECLNLLGDDLQFNLPENKPQNQLSNYELVVQKNGKKLFTFQVSSELLQEDIINIINEKYPNYNLNNYKNVIYIKYKIINFVY